MQHLHDVGVRSGTVLQQLCSTQAAIASTCSFWGEACEINWVMCGIGACGLRQVCQACELRQTANRRRQSPEPPAINCERLEIDLCIHKAHHENIQTYKPTHVRICKLSTTCIPYMSSALILVYGCWQPTHKHDSCAVILTRLPMVAGRCEHPSNVRHVKCWQVVRAAGHSRNVLRPCPSSRICTMR